MVLLLLSLSGQLWAQNYVYQRQIGSQAQGLFQLNHPNGVAVDRSGNRYVLDNGSVVKFASSGRFLFQFGSQGSGNGQFQLPGGLAVDGSGNLYVADTYNHRIQKFDASGRFLAKFGQAGSSDGSFQNVAGVAVDGSGNLYATDYYEGDTKNHRVQKFDASGRFLARFGSYGTGDGQFNRPSSIAVDGSGHLYVVDGFNHRVQKFDTSGRFLAKLDKQGSGDGQLGSPGYVAVDGSHNLYVAELGNHRIQKFDSSGRFLLKFGQQGNGQGQFQDFTGLAVEASGNIFVSDQARVQQFDSAGRFLSIVGSDGTGDGQFLYPTGVTADGSGNLYVTDYNQRVQKFDAQGRLLLKFGSQGTGEGQFQRPVDVGVDGGGNLYVVDTDNHRIQKFDSQGRFLLQFDHIDTDDVQFQTNPIGLAVAANGHLYVVDAISHNIQKFDASGHLLLDFHNPRSGDGRNGYSSDVALDGRGNLYVTDSYNHFVQKFDSTGRLLLQFGSQGTGDGQFQSPVGVAVDGRGNVYVTDTDNHRIQKFDSTGHFLLQFGSQGSGDGQFHSPVGVAVDGSGTLYVADSYNHRVQVFGQTETPQAGILRLNSGGPALGTSLGNFLADASFNGASTVNTSNVAVSNTTDDVLYQDYRRGTVAGGSFGYNLPVANGSYTVKLHFAEVYFTAVGKRVFNVSAEGAAWLTNYDVVADVGAKKAVVKTRNVTISDGSMTLNFSSLTNFAMVAAIEIVPITTVRLNSGGAALGTSLGNFSADASFTDLSRVDFSNVAVSNTTDDALYQDYRRGTVTGGSFGYSIPVTNGSYTVKLHFAEVYFTAVGKRVFNVSAEGAAWLTNYDVVADVGAKTAVVKTRNVTVSDGSLTLNFTSLTNFAMVAAIEVVPVPATTLHLNSGGAALGTSLGNFSADASFTDLSRVDFSNVAVSNTTDDALYQDYRRGTVVGGSFGYSIPVTNGSYTVKLHFAEVYFTAVGKRVFNVSAEGAAWLTNYDVVADVGAKTAVVKTRNVTVTDGILTLNFTSLTNFAMVAAIEVVPIMAARESVKDQIVQLEALLEAMPNPFSEKVTLHFSLPSKQKVVLEVYNLQGQLVKRLFEDEVQANQLREVEWNAEGQSTGMYVIRLNTPQSSHYKKILLQR